MKRPLAIVIGGLLLVTLARGPAQAAPGDPFGGDDPGCVPDTKDHLKCSKGALSAICKAWRAVIKCHTKQADTVFKTGAPADDETCEKSGGGKAALEKLNAALGKLATVCTGTTVIANANMVRDTLFGDNTAGSIDAMNGDIYCDPGIPIDSSGDDPGSVNNTATDAKGRQKCADSVEKDLSKLLGAVCKCHTKAASQGFANTPFDEENACEETKGGKGAHEKYTADVAKLDPSNGGPCTQPCLDAAHRATLGMDLIATVEAFNDKFYPCPTTTTTSTTLPGPSCCGFAPNPSRLKFQTSMGAGNCGTLTVGTGPISLACGGFYFGGGSETFPLPATVPDQGVSLYNVTSCSEPALTLSSTTSAETGSIRTCTSPVGTCTAAALGTCDTTTFACTGSGICTSGTCTRGRVGLSCVASSDCDFDCGNDHDCDMCTAGNVGAHCNTTLGGDHQCSCLFGAPQPVVNTPVPNASFCLINSIGNSLATAVSGAGDCSMGTLSLTLPLNGEVYLTGDLMPKRCSAATTGGKAGFNCISDAQCPGGTCANDSAIQSCPICNPVTLRCNGGPNEGAPCTPGNSNLGSAGPTSHDCLPPHVGAEIVPLLMSVAPITGTSLRTSFSTGGGNGKSNIFCGFCKNPSGGFQNPPTPPTGCTSDAQCTTAPFTSCEQNLNGAFAHADATMIEEHGVVAGDLTTGMAKSAALGSAFCIAPTYCSICDSNLGTPGPGAVALPGTAQLLP